MLIMSTLLTVLSYCSALQDSIFQRYGMDIHTFRTPHFLLGIDYQEAEAGGYPVDQLRIGMIFFVFYVTTYKVNEEVLQEFPHLEEGRFCWSQKFKTFCASVKSIL